MALPVIKLTTKNIRTVDADPMTTVKKPYCENPLRTCSYQKFCKSVAAVRCKPDCDVSAISPPSGNHDL